MTEELTAQELATLEEMERIRFWLLMVAGVFTLGATILSAYIAIKKPGV